ncbi:MAG: hypothetical protein ACK5KQ_02065 [Anaerorhabdus sp.]
MKEKRPIDLNKYINISLILNLFILLTPIMSFRIPSVVTVVENTDIKLSVFLTKGQLFLEELYSLIFESLNFRVGYYLRIVLLVITIIMIIKFILKAFNILKISNKIDKIIDYSYYISIIVSLVIFIGYNLINEVSRIYVNYAYYALVVIAIISLIAIKNEKIKVSLNSKYLLSLLVFPLIYSFYVSLEIPFLKSTPMETLDFLFNILFILENDINSLLLCILLILIIVVVVGLDYNKKINPKLFAFITIAYVVGFFAMTYILTTLFSYSLIVGIDIKVSLITILYLCLSAFVFIDNLLKVYNK